MAGQESAGFTRRTLQWLSSLAQQAQSSWSKHWRRIVLLLLALALMRVLVLRRRLQLLVALFLRRQPAVPLLRN